MAKSLGLSCSIVTYGVIIKALLGSRNPALQSKAFEILNNIPAMGQTLNVEIFNQVLLLLLLLLLLLRICVM